MKGEMRKGELSSKILIVIVTVVILIILAVFFRKYQAEPEETLVYYGEYPEEWVDKVNETTMIDVMEATQGHSDYLFGYQRYIDTDGQIFSMSLSGSYNGQPFVGGALDQQGNYTMIIDKEIVPNDGIIEGFALMREEQGKIVLYAYIDEDWKMQSNGYINLIWADNISDSAAIQSRQFDFSNGLNGIYFDKIDQDFSWLRDQNPLVGRIFIGEINIDDVRNDNFNRTFLAVV